MSSCWTPSETTSGSPRCRSDLIFRSIRPRGTVNGALIRTTRTVIPPAQGAALVHHAVQHVVSASTPAFKVSTRWRIGCCFWTMRCTALRCTMRLDGPAIEIQRFAFTARNSEFVGPHAQINVASCQGFAPPQLARSSAFTEHRTHSATKCLTAWTTFRRRSLG